MIKFYKAMAVIFVIGAAVIIFDGFVSVTTVESAQSALKSTTWEVQDDTGLKYNIPVGITDISFGSDAKTCVVRSKFITDDDFSSVQSGSVAVVIQKYIDNGKPYASISCSAISYQLAMNNSERLSARLGDHYFSVKKK